MHPGQKLRAGGKVIFEGAAGAPAIHGEVLERRFYGRRVIRLWTDDGSPVDAAVDAIGHVPLPPYIKRDDSAERSRALSDRLCARARVGGGADGGTAFQPRARGGARARAAWRSRGSRSTSATARFSRSGPNASRIIGSSRSATRSASRRRPRSTRALDAGRRVVAVGHDDDADARGGGGRARRPLVAGDGATDLFIYPGFAVPRHPRAADEFSPAAVVAADARVGVCGTRARAGGVPRSRRRAAIVFTATATRC